MPEKVTHGWFKFPRSLAQCKILTPAEKAMLLAILSRCNPIRDECFQTWAGNKTFREDTGFCDRQIRKVLTSLVKRQAITVVTTPRSRMITVNEFWDGIRSEETDDFRDRTRNPSAA